MCKVHETSCFTAEQDQQINANSVATVRPSRARGPRSNKAASRSAAARSSAGAAASASAGINHASSSGIHGEEAASTNQNFGATPFRSSIEPVADSEDGTHVIGPVLDAEARSIENYLANGTSIGMPISLKWWASLGDPLSGAQPVAFNKRVRSKPLGAFSSENVAASKCAIVEKLMEPHGDSIIDL